MSWFYNDECKLPLLSQFLSSSSAPALQGQEEERQRRGELIYSLITSSVAHKLSLIENCSPLARVFWFTAFFSPSHFLVIKS